MKRLLLFIFAVGYCLILPAQGVSLSELEGLTDDKGDRFFEWAGYNIYMTKIKTPDNKKDIAKIKKEYKIEDDSKEYSNIYIDAPNYVIESVTDFEKNGQEYSEIKVLQLLYIVEDGKGESDLILFSRAGERDRYMENMFLDLYLNDDLSGYMVSTKVDSIDFAGRNVRLGNLCEWRSPHNINCMGGQISWSVFDSPERADDEVNMYIFKNDVNNLIVTDDSDVRVLFEGEQALARRTVYEPVHGYNPYPLIVYYLWVELRGKYVSCIMSYYGNDKNDYELPDLLREFMQIEELPENAWNKYDYPAPDTLSSEQKQKLEEARKETRFKHYYFSFKSGAYLPLGGQRDFSGTSPYFSISLNLFNYYGVYDPESVNSSMFFEFGFAIPNNRKYFDFYDKDLIPDAKASVFFNMNLGYLHKTKVKRNVYWENYAKIGMSILDTNKEKPRIDEDANRENYNVGVFSFGLGTSFRYKRVGLFLEYQFAPYNMSKHLKTGGNSAVIAGLNITI